MRRKSDMFREFGDGDQPFLPAESEQAASIELQRMRDRLAVVEDQLKSQFTSIATYAAISQQTVETARAEARADLDREKATLIKLLAGLFRVGVAAPCHGAKRECRDLQTRGPHSPRLHGRDATRWRVDR